MEEKNLRLELGALVYYLAQHVLRNGSDVRFSKKYLNTFLDGFFRNSELMGYNLISLNNEVVKTTSPQYSKFLGNTRDMILQKFSTKVDDVNDLFCIQYDMLKPLSVPYSKMSNEMSNCILEYEMTLVYNQYFNTDNIKLIENDYCQKSKQLSDEYSKQKIKNKEIYEA